MIQTSTNIVFFDSTHQRFRCNDYHHCPRYVLMRHERIEHQMYSPVIDTVYDAVTKAAESVYAPEVKTHGSLEIPCTEAKVPCLARTVMSPTVSQWIREGNPPREDVLIAGLYSHLYRSMDTYNPVVHIHYVQPRTLISHHQTVPVMYRPFFVTCNDGGIVLLNMQSTRLPVKLAVDGLAALDTLCNDRKVPKERPLPLALKDQTSKGSCCDRCPYRALCHKADRLGLYTFDQLSGMNFVAGEHK